MAFSFQIEHRDNFDGTRLIHNSVYYKTIVLYKIKIE